MLQELKTYNNKNAGLLLRLFGNVSKVTIHRPGGKQVSYLLTNDQYEYLQQKEKSALSSRYKFRTDDSFKIIDKEDYRNIYFALKPILDTTKTPAHSKKTSLPEHVRMAWWEAFKKEDEQLRILHMMQIQMKSGLPVEEALYNVKFTGGLSSAGEKLINEALDRLRVGASIAQTFEPLIPECFIAPMRAIEGVGRSDELLEILKYIIHEMEGNLKVRSQVIQSFTYPAITLVISLLFMLISILYIFPIFMEVFESMSIKVPFTIALGYYAGQLLRSPYLAITMAFLLPTIVYYIIKFNKTIQNSMENFIIKHRIFGIFRKIIQVKFLIQFSRIILTYLKIGFFRHLLTSSSPAVSFRQIKKPALLFIELKNHIDPANKRIWGLLDQRSRNIILNWEPDQGLNVRERSHLVSDINYLIRKRTLYDKNDFREINLPQEARHLLEKGLAKIPAFQLQRFNRLLIETIYPDSIVKSKSLIGAFAGHFSYDILLDMITNLEEGKGLLISEPLYNNNIDPVYCSFFSGLEVPQYGASLLSPEALNSLIRIFEIELEALSNDVSSLMEPFFTIAIGLITSAIILSVFIPLLKMISRLN